jgi:hypothetical protein
LASSSGCGAPVLSASSSPFHQPQSQGLTVPKLADGGCGGGSLPTWGAAVGRWELSIVLLPAQCRCCPSGWRVPWFADGGHGCGVLLSGSAVATGSWVFRSVSCCSAVLLWDIWACLVLCPRRGLGLCRPSAAPVDGAASVMLCPSNARVAPDAVSARAS